jgi:predicted ATPase
MIRTLAIENYRSLRRVVVPLASLNVVTGANGSGKSSLYRALRLLADSARNGAVGAARHGGTELSAIELAKEFGETRVVGQEVLEEPAWHWPKR